MYDKISSVWFNLRVLKIKYFVLFLGQSKDKITKKYPFCMSKLGHSILIFRTVSRFVCQI